MELRRKIERDIKREGTAEDIRRNYYDPDTDQEQYPPIEINYGFFAQDAEKVRAGCAKIHEYLNLPLFMAFNQRIINELAEQLRQLATVAFTNRDPRNYQYELTVSGNLLKQLSAKIADNKQDLTRERRDTWQHLKIELQTVLYMLCDIADDTTEELSSEIDP